MKIRARHERRHFFKYTTADAALKILGTGTVRYSSPLLFNDPFDLQWCLQFDFDVKSFPLRVLARIEHFATSNETPPPLWSKPVSLIRDNGTGLPRELRALLSPSLRSMTGMIERYQKEIQNHYENLLPRMRIFSVAEVHDHLLMWSHYADKHKGVVLELAVLPDIDNELCAAQPVTYQSTPPTLFTEDRWMDLFFSGVELGADELFAGYPFVKSDEWKYEREWRVYYPLPEPGDDLFTDHALRPSELAAIYLGCRMDHDEREALTSLLRLRFPDARVLQARRAQDEFKLVFDPVSPPVS